jgi:HAD superfamily hydrolase (TIGR01549 family)
MSSAAMYLSTTTKNNTSNNNKLKLFTNHPSPSQSRRQPKLEGVVFDMDGTLTVPNIDFLEMYRRCGIHPSKDILAEIDGMTEPEQKERHAIICEMEQEAIETMRIMPGALEVMDWLYIHRIPSAIVTRNTLHSARALQEQLHSTDLTTVIARDNTYHPPKPDPAAMHFLCRKWRTHSSNIIMVGDSPENDAAFGRRAGTHTALLLPRKPRPGNSVRSDNNNDDITKSELLADINLDRLYELPWELWNRFEIEGSMGNRVDDNVEQPAPKPTTDLTECAECGDLETIKLFMESIHRKRLNRPDKSKNTPLIWASDRGHVDVVDWLIKYASVHADHRGYMGATAACRAARHGHNEILNILIAAGADLDIPTSYQWLTPLHYAAMNNNREAVEALLYCRVNPRKLDRTGRTPVQLTQDEQIRNRLLKYMKEMDQLDDDE